MLQCILCNFETELDDAVVASRSSSRCICLRCFNRETNSEMRMTKGLRRELMATLATIE